MIMKKKLIKDKQIQADRKFLKETPFKPLPYDQNFFQPVSSAIPDC